MSLLVLVKLSYFVAATLFLLGLQRMASPKTARSGIQWAGVGMLIATVATFFLPGLHNIGLMVAAIVIGLAGVASWLTPLGPGGQDLLRRPFTSVPPSEGGRSTRLPERTGPNSRASSTRSRQRGS